MASFDLAKRREAMAQETEATASVMVSSLPLFASVAGLVSFVTLFCWLLFGIEVAKFAFVISVVLMTAEAIGGMRARDHRAVANNVVDMIVQYQASDDAGEVNRMKAQSEGFRAIQEGLRVQREMNEISQPQGDPIEEIFVVPSPGETTIYREENL